jgi:hypothetical protein
MAIKINGKSKIRPNSDCEKTIEDLERVFLSGEDNVFRDDAWPEGIELGWRSLNADSMLLFYFNFKNERLVLDDELCLKSLGFVYSDQSRTYNKKIVVPKGKDIGDGTFSGLIPKLQKFFIDDICRNDIEPVIKTIIVKL